MADNKSNRIGYRYLFDSKGCSLSNRKEVTINLVVSEKYDVQLYFGPKPQYKIDSVVGGSRYYIPGTKTPLGKWAINSDASQSSEHGPFFLEIVVSIEASTVEADSATTLDLLIRQAETRRDEFKNIIDLAAGIIGLRFHRQFVLELLNENALAWKGQESIKGFAGPAVEILQSVALTDTGIKQLETIGGKLKTLAFEDAHKYSLIFHWLLRAWHERDILHKFIDLFIPLECVLNMSSDLKMSVEDKHRADSIRLLIRKHADDQSKELCCFLDKAVQYLRPTLNEMFTDFAEMAKLPGWESDIEAFKKFKRMRNDIFHGKGKEIQQGLSVNDNKEVREFSDLVERYINYFFFKDKNVYRSRFRPNIQETNNNGNT